MAAAPVAGLAVLGACSSGGSSAPVTVPTTAGAASTAASTAAGPKTGGTVTMRLSAPFTSYNSGTADDNSTWNQEVLNAVQPAVAKFDQNANVVIDANLATVTKTGDAPLVVQYAFNPAAVWADGHPVGCDDVHLAWVANNGSSSMTDGDGATVPLFQTASTTGWDQVASVACSPDDRTATMTYTSPFSDWKALVRGLLPAHVVADRAGVGTSAAIRTAYEAHDQDALGKIATFWNTGFKSDRGVDPAVDLSAGPYRIDAAEQDQSITLVRNDRYWGPRPPLDRIIFRVIADPTAQVQALSNGEVDVIQIGGPAPDAVALLDQQTGVQVKVGASNSFEHFDFNFRVPLFQDLAVRQAVAQCLPRKDILDKLIVPTDPGAVLQQHRMLFIGQAGYRDTSGGRYDAVDINGAKATLEAAGWTLDGDVYAKDGQRLQFKLLHSASRAAEAQLIEASCAQAGIDVVDDADPTWGPRLGTGQFETVLFGWTVPPTQSGNKAIYHTPPDPKILLSNYGSYSNERLDGLMDQLTTALDPAELVNVTNEADTLLWDDVATIPLWRLPSVVASSDRVSGVVPNPTDQSLTWNVETWSLA